MKKIIRVSVLLSIFSMGSLSIVDASCPANKTMKRKGVISQSFYTISQCPLESGNDYCCVAEAQC
ncbi:hypothetical protein [Flectobacillus sp.]|uniref:hypothetical protein n=1 Tax=Flectobacillus sp. TaxID=50419 RepID=UPI003BAC45C9